MKDWRFISGVVGLLLGVLFSWVAPVAAHSGSPALTTFSNGQTLTATSLNNNFSHLHNTFTGGLTNEHISASAGISHSKLATPALVPKAFAQTSLCDGAGGVNCTITAGAGVTTVQPGGVAGRYNIYLSYTPVNGNFSVLVGHGLSIRHSCTATTRQAAAPHFRVECFDSAGALTNVSLDLLVMDDN